MDTFYITKVIITKFKVVIVHVKYLNEKTVHSMLRKESMNRLIMSPLMAKVKFNYY